MARPASVTPLTWCLFAMVSLLPLAPGCTCALSRGRYTFDSVDGGVDSGPRDAAATRDAGRPTIDGGMDGGSPDSGPGCPPGCAWGCVGGVCNDPVEVVAGANHTCARRAQGQVYCWGRNVFGQLGDSTIDARNRPVPVGGLNDAVDLGAGEDHTCAVRATGRVVCWGKHDQGQLGTGSIPSSLPNTMPLPVANVMDAMSVGVGCMHSCAVGRMGNGYCWGSGAGGQLGDGTMSITPQPFPVGVMALRDFVDITGGGLYTCARRSGGSASCWGFNSEGELGDGTMMQRVLPMGVSLTGIFTELDAGTCGATTCAIVGGQAWCWGFNGVGNLGNNMTRGSSVPVQVRGLNDALRLSVGQRHACAVRQGGSVVCWGDNNRGQLGDGTMFQRETFVGVTSELPIGAQMVAAGQEHSCALLSSGHIYCWGSNDDGQLGDSTNMPRRRAVMVTPP